MWQIFFIVTEFFDTMVWFTYLFIIPVFVSYFVSFVVFNAYVYLDFVNISVDRKCSASSVTYLLMAADFAN